MPMFPLHRNLAAVTLPTEVGKSTPNFFSPQKCQMVSFAILRIGPLFFGKIHPRISRRKYERANDCFQYRKNLRSLSREVVVEEEVVVVIVVVINCAAMIKNISLFTYLLDLSKYN